YALDHRLHLRVQVGRVVVELLDSPGRLLERDQVEDRVVRRTPETDDTEQPARATQLEVAPQVLGREATVAPHAEVGEPVLRALADPDDQPALARLFV